MLVVYGPDLDVAVAIAAWRWFDTMKACGAQGGRGWHM